MYLQHLHVNGYFTWPVRRYPY